MGITSCIRSYHTGSSNFERSDGDHFSRNYAIAGSPTRMKQLSMATKDCEQSLFFFSFSKGNVSARER